MEQIFFARKEALEPLCYNFPGSIQCGSNLALKCSVENDDADEADGKNMAQRESDQLG